MRISVSDAGSANRNLSLMSDRKDMAPEAERLKRDQADYDKAEAALGKFFELDEITPREHQLFDEVKSLKLKALSLVQRAAELGLANKADEATAALLKDLDPVQRASTSKLNDLVVWEDEFNRRAGDDAHATYARARWIFIGLTGAVAVLAIGLGVLARAA